MSEERSYKPTFTGGGERERERLLMTWLSVCYASVRLHSENKCVFPIVLTLVIDTSVMFL